MNSSKIAYILSAVLLAGLVVLLGIKLSNNKLPPNPQNSQTPAQNPVLPPGQTVDKPSQPPQSPAPPPSANTKPITSCPNGQNVTQTDSRGRFKPTFDISNKTVILDTTMGKISLRFYDQDAPKTVENFICLVKRGYYNGVTFHRVAHNFVIQAGDPTGSGAGGESVYGQPFEDELYPDAASYKAGYLKGTLAMANRGTNTNTSQFFILTADRPELQKNYTIFGKVSIGMDVAAKIGAVEVIPGQFGPEDGAPKTKITINKAFLK